MSLVDQISRTQAGTGVANLLQENFAEGVVPWINHACPVAGLFEEMGAGNYTLTGKELVIAGDFSPTLNYQGTDGWIGDAQEQDVVRIKTTPARLYSRGAIDNFIEAVSTANSFENHFARINRQMLDAVERKTSFHVHGSTAGTVAQFVSRTSATVLVVNNGYGYTGTASGQFIEVGAVLALLDASAAFAVIGAAEVSGVAYNTPSAGQTTVTFASAIDSGTDGQAGDPLVFATTTNTSAANFVTERNRAPLGLLNIVDPGATTASFMDASETTYPRWRPTRAASSDFGFTEIMELAYQIGARSQMQCDGNTHVLTTHPGIEIELAKELLGYQQQNQLGMTLAGGWETVRVGPWSLLSDPYHLHNVVYMLCLEDLYVVPLNNEMLGYIDEDGSRFQRILNYDGREWTLRSYLQRFTNRRIRHGALTGVPNPSFQRFSAQPV
jgi:hypothetical protein